MIGSLLVGLEAKDDVRLRGNGGEALHGLFFTLLRRTAMDVASHLHRADEQKPFSLSPLLEGHELQRGYTNITSGRTACFRINILTEELLTLTVKTFFLWLAEGKALSLCGKPITITTVDIGSASNISVTSFTRLLLESCAQPVVTLEFISPTSFKRNEVQIVFPEPQLVFSSLLRRWNAFSELKLPDEYLELLPSIKVSNYSLSTELIHFSRYKVIGFKGIVEYTLPQETPEPFRKAMNALADFACYAGVGAKTTMGMGHTRRIKPQGNSSMRRER